MIENEEIKNSLDIIYKSGDLFDVISLKEGVAISKNAFYKFNILFLSRILYIGVLIGEKIKQKITSVEKVRNAQEQIRKYLGFKVDIITFKPLVETSIKERFKKRFLSLLYVEDDINSNLYINNLQKILRFVKMYSLDKVYLRISDIESCFMGIDLAEFKSDTMENLMGGYLDYLLNEDLLCLLPDELAVLIKKLQKMNINKKYIADLGDKIKDVVIKNAVNNFILNEDLEQLRYIVRKRLELIIDSDNSYKDRINGKVYENVMLKGIYVKVLRKKQNGDVISDRVISLYDYFEVSNYQTLISKINSICEEREEYAVVALYLYLLQNKEISKNNKETITFYDSIYRRYEMKLSKKVKRIRGIYSKKYKYLKNLMECIFCLQLNFILLISLFLTGVYLDYLNGSVFSDEESNILDNLFNTVVAPYKYSLQIEFEAFKKIIGEIDYTFLDFCNVLTGDVESNDNSKVLAQVNNISDCELPKYFATSYAIEADYDKGRIQYLNTFPRTIYLDNVRPLFEIVCFLDSDDLKNLVKDNKLNALDIFYPVGDNYILTSILIEDMVSGLSITIDLNRVREMKGSLSSNEIDMILGMEKPKIVYTYGVSYVNLNTFVKGMIEDGYNGGIPEIKQAILKGLNLNYDASLEEIWRAIKSKTYSTTPIKDAGLSFKIKTFNKEEYFEAIAGMDSLVCNLAASLAVESADDLFYVVGYLNNNDDFILSGEAHAWAMDYDGNIIEVTPSTLALEEENVIFTVLSWGLQNNIHIYIILILCSLLIERLFGKKIVLSLKILKIKKLLDDPNIFDAYAKINEVLYGGINIPRKTSKVVFVDKVCNDFMGYTKEDLANLKEKLRVEIKTRKLMNSSIKIVDEVSNIKENYKELKRVLEREK